MPRRTVFVRVVCTGGRVGRVQACLAATVSLFFATSGNAQNAIDSVASKDASKPEPVTWTLSARQVFALADEARKRGDFIKAENAYRALTNDQNIEMRTEARFRLGMMLADNLNRYSDAAIEFRRILDEKPNASRVRLELARMQAMLGDFGAARKELRAVQAAGLPQEVEQIVRFYSQALNAKKTFGGSAKIALAPDSNINRATRSDTLGTVIGDFALDKDAQARSGIGLDLQGQGYLRLGVQPGTDILVRASGSATLYRDADFNDITVGIQAGPQFQWGANQLTLSLGPSRRWYGRDPYSVTVGGNISWQRPLGKRSQVRVEGGVSHVSNKRNKLQTADNFVLSAGIDHAFTARSGGGFQVYGFREEAGDPGYSLASGGISGHLFRELGRSTVIGTLGYSRLEADKRLFLYPKRRMEDRYTASLAVTLRSLQIGGFAPLARLKWERNRSSIEIYDYRRLAAEFGVTSAF